MDCYNLDGERDDDPTNINILELEGTPTDEEVQTQWQEKEQDFTHPRKKRKDDKTYNTIILDK